MKRIVLIAIAWLVVAAPAAAEQVQLGWRTVMEYDSEVTSIDGGEDDLIFTFGPLLRIEGDYRRFRYQIEQSSEYEHYIDLGPLSDWRHELRANFVYDISPQVQIQLNNSFQQLPQIRNGNIDDAAVDAAGASTSFVEAGRVRTNVFTATLATVPTVRLTTTSQLSVIFREFDNATLNAQNTLSTGILNQLSYQLNERHSFGGGFRFSSRDFETGLAGQDELTDATTQTWEVFASWLWQVDSRSTFSVQIGPAFSSDDVDRNSSLSTSQHPIAGVVGGSAFLRDPASCPAENARPGGVLLTDDCIPFLNQDMASVFFPLGIPVGSQTFAELTALQSVFPLDEPDDSAANVFFAFQMDRRWDRARASLSWSRSDSQTQALGSNTVVDNVLFDSIFDLSSRMRFLSNFRFTRRFSEVERELVGGLLLSDTVGPIPDVFTPDGVPLIGAPIVGFVPVDSSFDQEIRTYRLQFRLVRDWGRWLSSFVSLTLRRQENDLDSDLDTLDSETKRDSFIVRVGFSYQFKPIDL